MSNGPSSPASARSAPDPVDDRREVVWGAGRLPVLDRLDDEAVPAGGAAHRTLGGPRADDPTGTRGRWTGVGRNVIGSNR